MLSRIVSRKYIIFILFLVLISSGLTNCYKCTINEKKYQVLDENYSNKDNLILENSCTKKVSIGFINITVFEAWDMLNSTEDEKKILIDVRRLPEYLTERIDVPNQIRWPKWFAYELTDDGPGPIKNEGFLLDLFIKIFEDEEIIIYCRTGNRTCSAAQILIDNGFQGTVYNMVGGITEWKEACLPIDKGIFSFF